MAPRSDLVGLIISLITSESESKSPSRMGKSWIKLVSSCGWTSSHFKYKRGNCWWNILIDAFIYSFKCSLNTYNMWDAVLILCHHVFHFQTIWGPLCSSQSKKDIFIPLICKKIFDINVYLPKRSMLLVLFYWGMLNYSLHLFRSSWVVSSIFR